MTEFADSVRAGSRHLSALGRPDARLHLPKHHAIASFTTPGGRQQPFLAQTTPLKVDAARISFHLKRQEERGGRYLADLRQWHWAEPDPSAVADGRGESSAPARPREEPARTARRVVLPSRATKPAPGAGEVERGEAPASYRELVSIDGANRMRIVSPGGAQTELEPDATDLEVLALVASLRHVLSTQIHRRFNGGRAQTTTQRRLKRLAEARLLSRLQFHRGDGAGTPICYAITESGIAALGRGRSRDGTRDRPLALTTAPSPPRPGEDRRGAAQVRHELHVSGWVLALELTLGGGSLGVRGPGESVISPLVGRGEQNEHALAPRDLRLPAGRTAHDFHRTIATGERVEVERFETVRPDATVELPGGTDLLVELDDRLPIGTRAQKLERYDHLISGWAMHTKRYGARLGRPPRAVFVCRDPARARECARRADSALVACQAYPGRYPEEWEFPGRAGILFAAERDVHAGALWAYGLHRLPPQVRASRATNGPGARLAEPRPLELLTGAEVPAEGAS
jgi:Replication-relaxation